MYLLERFVDLLTKFNLSGQQNHLRTVVQCERFLHPTHAASCAWGLFRNGRALTTLTIGSRSSFRLGGAKHRSQLI